MKRLLAANWKMNLTAGQSSELAQEFLGLSKKCSQTDLWIAASYPTLERVQGIVSGSSVALGAQNVHWEPAGAYTGEVSVPMLKEWGCSFSIVGHSERRHGLGEDSELVAQRAAGALEQGLSVIACIGETLEEREGARTEQVLAQQLKPLTKLSAGVGAATVVLAYEPVWAIGTGKVATVAEITEAHKFIHDHWQSAASSAPPPILYGGSVSPSNFEEIAPIPRVSGALVGGASLSAEKFGKLVEISEACPLAS